MNTFGLKNGYVKANLNVTTIKELAKQLYEMYEDDIKYMLNEELGVKNP
jgi:hypothetical protein